MAGSFSPHMALQRYFQYAIECTEPQVFNWADVVLCSIKKQLPKCRGGNLKQFGYGSLLVSFFLEWVPIFRLQVEWNISGPRDPRMLRWCRLMARNIAGPIVKYDDIFFDWLQTHMLMVDDYAYAGLDFRGDPDLALLEDTQWGDLGKKYTHFLFLNVFEIFYHIQMFLFYMFVQRLIQNCFLITQMLDLTDLSALLPSSGEER
jgi:hypothetical protein